MVDASSSFFCERDSFAALAAALPRLLEMHPIATDVRVWVMECSTGETAYSIAMLLEEAIERMPAGRFTLRIFATDVDEASLAVARAGVYPDGIAADVEPERLSRFFVREQGSYRVRAELRRKLVFAIHDPPRDLPFTRLDLLVWLDPPAKIEPRSRALHFALRPQGLLLLGGSGSIAPSCRLFRGVAERAGLFERAPLSADGARLDHDRRDLFVRALIKAHDDERRRLARELHDGAGQSLASIELGLARLAQLTDDPQVREHTERLAAIARRAADEVRRCSRGLHPSVLDDLGLAPALERLAADESKVHGIEVVAHVTGLDGLDRELALALYRVAQEALSNALMHGRAEHIVIMATRGTETLELTVTDDGDGFLPGARRAGGLGLRSMRQRVEELGGTFVVASAPRKGTSVRALLPMGAHET